MMGHSWKKGILKGAATLLIIIITILTAYSSESLANPIVPNWHSSGLPTIPNDAIGVNVPTLIDPNNQDLLFTKEYVVLDISNYTSLMGELNATYTVLNSGTYWINQTIAIPASYVLNEKYYTATEISVDGIEMYWYLGIIHIPEWNLPDIYTESQEYPCYLINITFAPGQDRTIEYSSPIPIWKHISNLNQTFIPPPGNLSTQYIVTTRDSWLHTIQDATIIFKIAEGYLKHMNSFTPDEAIYDNSSDYISIKWHFQNWIPEQEITIYWTPLNWPIKLEVNQTEITCLKNEIISLGVNAYTYNEKDTTSSFQYFYDFGDGNTSGWVSEQIINYTYAYSGIYYLRIWAREFGSQIISENKTVIVTINENTTPEIPPGQQTDIWLMSIVLAAIIVTIILAFAYNRKRRTKKKSGDAAPMASQNTIEETNASDSEATKGEHHDQ